ncbi:ion channel [Salininema proteolyticum]|uniref:Ion channel n=1 Tax=Salininema proteolyticum TaxID=1607685 RepID=A0ABV8TXD0_9ACTN
MPPDARQQTEWPDRLLTWERKTSPLLMFLAIAFLIAYSTRVLFPGLPDGVRTSLLIIDYAIWGLFALEYAWRLTIVGKGLRADFIRATPLEFFAVLLPPARPLRLLRATIVIIDTLTRHTRLLVRTRLSVLVLGSTAMLVFLSALAVLDVERDAPSNINTFADSIWWAFVTITTVGYGDYSPVTPMARIIAIALMIIGIGLFGFVAATLASWITEKFARHGSETEEEIESEFGVVRRSLESQKQATRELTDEVAELRAQIADLTAALSESQRSPDSTADDLESRAAPRQN